MNTQFIQTIMNIIPDTVHYEITIKRESVSFKLHYDNCVTIKSYSRQQISKAYWDRIMADIILADIRKAIRQVTGGDEV